VRVRNLDDVTLAEAAGAEAVAYFGAAVMEEQRETHRNAQEIHGIRRYSEIVHRHPQEQACRGKCEFWSPE
jgi:hypothetical protein